MYNVCVCVCVCMCVRVRWWKRVHERFGSVISEDGVHPNAVGYQVSYQLCLLMLLYIHTHTAICTQTHVLILLYIIYSGV